MKKRFADRVKELRLLYCLETAAFAKHCGLSQLCILHYEAGRIAKPQIKAIVKIAGTYNTTVQWLLNGEGEMLNNGIKASLVKESAENQTAKQYAYEEIKSRCMFLEQEVERLWQILAYLTKKNTADHKAISREPAGHDH